MGLQAVHRPGPLKQSNKSHKSGRKKKKDQNEKGRTDVKTLTISKKHDLKRKDRKNRALQLRKNKRDEALSKKRGLGGEQSPPILVGIIPLDHIQDPYQLLEGIKSCDEDLLISDSKRGHCHISSSRLKQRFTFVCPKLGNMNDVLDIAKVANVLLLIHTTEELDEYVETLLSGILSHALPTTIHVALGFDLLNPKKKSEMKKAVLKAMESRFPDEKLYPADTKQDFLVLLRNIGAHKIRPIAFRDARAHLLAESFEFVPNANQEISTGTLKVSGYMRGQPLNVNSLVHIPSWGDFQMSQIDYITDPHPLCPRKNKAKPEKVGNSKDEDMMLDERVIVDIADPARQESLQSEIIPDPMEGEQTWPTEEELQEATKGKKVGKKITQGSNAYQASWIVDSDGSEDEDDDSEDDDMKSERSDGDQFRDFNADDDQESVADGDVNKYDENLDMDEEKKTLVRFREEQMEQLFPDERDTPFDIPARTRYQRYRGLKSFTNSTWDPMENLPPEYSRIYRFENFRHMKKKILHSEKDGALPGLYVTLHITNVPSSLCISQESSPMVVYGLLPHEQKMSCINVVITKHHSCTEPIKSKDRLIFHLGFRRFVCQPLFSVHSVGNKHKFVREYPVGARILKVLIHGKDISMTSKDKNAHTKSCDAEVRFEKFLSNDGAVVASFFAPVIFPPCSAVVFQQKSDGTQQLVATGAVMDVNPDRLIIKRIVLSGHPFKIMKKSAVVRYMFFNRDDIMYFKRIELRTKYGRKGHIREPLGTHGHMKCVFDQQLKSQDVVLMSLYKRIFPKWTYDPCVPTPCSPYDLSDVFMM